jgi:hypothetical protein
MGHGSGQLGHGATPSPVHMLLPKGPRVPDGVVLDLASALGFGDDVEAVDAGAAVAAGERLPAQLDRRRVQSIA